MYHPPNVLRHVCVCVGVLFRARLVMLSDELQVYLAAHPPILVR